MLAVSNTEPKILVFL